MRLYVVITEKCQDDADRHGQSPLVQNLKRSIEDKQALPGFHYFLPTPFLKKCLGRSFRLICYRAPIGGDELILFLRVLARGSSEYEAFLANWDKDPEGITRQFQPYDDAALKKIHENLTKEPPPPQLPPPSDEERGWLYEVMQNETPDDELLVLETEAWVKWMREPANRDFLALYHQILEEMVDTSRLHQASTNGECCVHWGSESKKRFGVAYLYRPDLNRLLLLEPLRHSDDVDRRLQEHRNRLSKMGEGQHELSRIAARGYPFLMVLDQDAWLAIQRDEEANLALSPEEAELLESIHRAGAKGALGYPLFINGRAGSGKSTMLHYLAADYMDYALRRNTINLPLYMTCSRELLEQARKTVRGILLAHHAKLLKGAHAPARVDEVLKNSFQVFHDFLYSLLPQPLQDKLPEDRYVNYAKFHRLWLEDFAKRFKVRGVSPEVSWHVIRSYIKGIRSSHDDDLTPEEFNALARRRRSVSKETYKEIYDNVWCRWYKPLCEQDRYWDNQDLAAHVLDAGVAFQVNCAAVFCDEAQDFTPIELDIIFQLSLFGRRSLQPEDLRRVPIVFAGDPLQTINPTGFRWDAVQADFHERFCAVLDPRRRARIDLTYRELRLNYRSKPGIVGFCNLIQLVRAALLGSGDIQPQKAWWIDAPTQTVWFAFDNSQTTQQLQRHPELVKLVNCEEGEENDYVRKDSILKTLKEESEGVYRNILGPARSKGLEFPAVVLYRFGETAPSDFAGLLSGDVSLGEQEERLPFEYFLNRLYVAASRAKNQLVVVDTRGALENFWRFATDPEIIDRLMEKAGGSEKWKDAIAYLVPGNEQTWSGERIDPREQAADYALQGRRKRDPYLLRQAALAYRSAGDEHEAGKCLALAAEFEENYRDAGNKYRELGLHDDAFRCYWTGSHWRLLCDLASQEPSLTSRLETRAADFMARADGLNSRFLKELVYATGEGDDVWVERTATDRTWRDVLSKVAERLAKAIGDETIPWSEVRRMLGRFVHAGVRISDVHLAAIAYAAKDYNEAVRLWEQSGSTERGEYFRAKAHITPFPESLIWFGKVKETAEVLRQWREHGVDRSAIHTLDEKVVRAVADAALEEGDLTLAAEMVQERPDRERVARLIAAALKSDDHTAASFGAAIATRLFAQQREWTAGIRAVEEFDFSDLPGIQADLLRSSLERTNSRATILGAFIHELSVSEDLPKETPERQSPVTEFLHRRFIGKGGLQADDHGLPPQEVGAAIERAGKIVDALNYYENLERLAPTPEIKNFATERLVRNLERHAEYYRAKGDASMARQRDIKAKQIRDRAGIGTRALPEFPLVDTQKVFVAPTEWIWGPFKIVLSRSHRRLRIEHTERFEMVTLDVKGTKLLGDAEFSLLPGQNDDQSLGWHVEKWNSTIHLIQRTYTQCIIRFNSDIFKIPLD